MHRWTDRYPLDVPLEDQDDDFRLLGMDDNSTPRPLALGELSRNGLPTVAERQRSVDISLDEQSFQGRSDMLRTHFDLEFVQDCTHVQKHLPLIPVGRVHTGLHEDTANAALADNLFDELQCPVDLSEEAVRGEEQQHLHLLAAEHIPELIEPVPLVRLPPDSKVEIDVLSRNKDPIFNSEFEDRSHLIFGTVLHPSAEPDVNRADGLCEVVRESSVRFGNELVDLSTRLFVTCTALCIDLRAFSRLSVPLQAGRNDGQHDGTEQG